jgi:hypothetical protein
MTRTAILACNAVGIIVRSRRFRSNNGLIQRVLGSVIASWALVADPNFPSHHDANNDENNPDQKNTSDNAHKDQNHTHRGTLGYNGHRCPAAGAGARSKTVNASLVDDITSKR